MCAAVNSSPPPQVTLSHSEQKSEKEIVQIPGRTKQKLAKKILIVVLYFFRDNVTNDGFRVLKFKNQKNEKRVSKCSLLLSWLHKLFFLNFWYF